MPRGSTRIRHYGLLANRKKAENLAACRAALGVIAAPVPPPSRSPVERLLDITRIDALKCPACAPGRMRRCRSLVAPLNINYHVPPLATCLNTS